MSDSFQGNKYITIQPGDVNVPLSMRLNPASASTANDGAIPYGSTVASATFTAHNAETGSSSTSSAVILTNTSEAGVSSSNVIIAYISYSTALQDGLYHITATVQCGLAGSTVLLTREFDFNRIFHKDR